MSVFIQGGNVNLYKDAVSRSGLTRRYGFWIRTGDRAQKGVTIAHLDTDGRVTVSASTLIGCPYRCSFCAQGTKEPLPLSAEQILGQVEAVLRDSPSAKLAGVRFDVSGEPLANWPAAKEAIRRLSMECTAVPILLVSAAPDVKWYPDLFDLGRELENLSLQFSVHASTEAERKERFQEDRLLALAEIGQKGEEWLKATGRRCSFNYALDGLTNASPAVAQRLADLFPPEAWECQITPTYAMMLAGARALGVTQLPVFQKELERYGYAVTVYAPLDGLEIQAVPGLG